MTAFSLLGTGGISRIIVDIITHHIQHYQVSAFYDDEPLKRGTIISGIPVTGTIREFIRDCDKSVFYHNCIGNINGIRQRILYSDQLKEKGIHPLTIIHPASVISKNSFISEGTFICPNVTVNSNASIGSENIIFSNTVVEHDVITGDHCYLSPSVTLCGKVKLEDHVYIGPGAIIGATVKIGRNTIIGAGSVVLKDIPDNSVYFGNPAVFQKKNELWSNL